MKKFMLSLLILAGVFTAVLAFHACSADDEAEEPQHSPQAQLLLQKSREFAKKYDVNMFLVIAKDFLLAQELSGKT